MAASLIGWIWQQKDLNPTARLVLFALNEHANIGKHGDWRVFPSHDRVAAMCGISRRTVIRSMNELQEAGCLTIAHQYSDNGAQQQNLYWLTAPKLIDSDPCDKMSHPPVKNSHTPCDKLSHKSFNTNPLKNNNLMFDEFWSLYPKKVDKKNSRAKFIKLPDNDQQLAVAYLKKKPFAEAMRTAPKDNPTKYVPCATKFINGARWEDEPTTKPTNGRTAL